MQMSLRLLISSESVKTVTAAVAIAVIFMAPNIMGVSAQQQQLTSQHSASESGATATTATLFQSEHDNFKLQLPPGWVAQDFNNTGFTLGVEVSKGYGLLAQLCPSDDQPTALPFSEGNLSSASSNGTTPPRDNNENNHNNCRGAQDVINIVRFPNLGAKLGFDSDDVITNEDVTPDIVLAYHIQKLGEAGYDDMRIVNSTDTTIDVISTSLNNSAIVTLPAKSVELTYVTKFAPHETKRGYLISTATDATPRNLGMITGYVIFFESTASAITAVQAMPPSSTLATPQPAAVRQIFDSFELMAGPEVEQAISTALALQAQAEEADDLTVEIDSEETEGVAPVMFELEADIAGGVEPYVVGWQIDDGDIVSNEPIISLTFNEAGTYDLGVTVIDAAGQTASDDMEITVEAPSIPPSTVPSSTEQVEDTEEIICDPSYPDVCIPPAPPTLTCEQLDASNFEVVAPDSHGFDDDNDGIGCETDVSTTTPATDTASTTPATDTASEEPDGTPRTDSFNFDVLVDQLVDSLV